MRKMVVTFPSTKGSRAIISIENGVRVLSLTEHTCEDKQTTYEAGCDERYAAERPFYITLIAAFWAIAERLPIRLYGGPAVISLRAI